MSTGIPSNVRKCAQQAVFEALDEVNDLQPENAKIGQEDHVRLLGAVESLALVQLIVAAEQALDRLAGVSIPLAERVTMAEGGPLVSVGTLVDYIATNLES